MPNILISLDQLRAELKEGYNQALFTARRDNSRYLESRNKREGHYAGKFYFHGSKKRKHMRIRQRSPFEGVPLYYPDGTPQ